MEQLCNYVLDSIMPYKLVLVPYSVTYPDSDFLSVLFQREGSTKRFLTKQSLDNHVKKLEQEKMHISIHSTAGIERSSSHRFLKGKTVDSTIYGLYNVYGISPRIDIDQQYKEYFE